MPTIGSLTTLAAGKAYRSEVNGNFTTIRNAVNTYAAFVDTSATISGAWTFSTAPTFTNAQTFAAGVTITTGGLTVTAGGLTVTAGASTFGAAVTITGTCTATTFSGSGASLTSLPAANLTGTIAAISGANLTNLNGSAIASGTVSASYLPTSYSALTVTTLTNSGITVNSQAKITFNASAGTAGSMPAFRFLSDYVYDASGSTPPAIGRAPSASGTWVWVRAEYTGSGIVGYVPMLTV